MQISDRGLQAIIKREGVFFHAYKDTVGVWTIGTGHTSAAGAPKVFPGMTITKAQNDEILRNDLKPIQDQFEEYVKVPVTQNQYDAIVSIVFNVGPRFWKSQCIRYLNEGKVNQAAAAIMQWSKPPEIIGRRRTEQVQFLTPDPKPTPIAHATAGAIVAAGGATAASAAASYPYHWHWILLGTAAAALVSWLAIRFFERRL